MVAEGWGELTFPEQDQFGGDDVTTGKIPFAIGFLADELRNKQSIRENAGIGSLANITLPMPKEINLNNKISYSTGQSETTGGVYDMTTQGWGEWIWTLGGFVSAGKDVTGVTSFWAQRPMDERDNIYSGAEFRNHSYSWLLIPKNKKQAQTVYNIAQAFQTLAYPMKSDWETYSRVIHPPIWHINVLDMANGRSNAHQWDMDPLPSVLTSVDIQTSGAAGGVYASHGGFPAATKISVNFIELEPAVNTGKYLQSRSQVRGGAARDGDSSAWFWGDDDGWKFSDGLHKIHRDGD